MTEPKSNPKDPKTAVEETKEGEFVGFFQLSKGRVPAHIRVKGDKVVETALLGDNPVGKGALVERLKIKFVNVFITGRQSFIEIRERKEKAAKAPEKK